MRRGMKFCLVCNPFENGMSGDEGTEAVAKYYLPKKREPGYSRRQANTGWIPCCRCCAELMGSQFEVQYFKTSSRDDITDIYEGPFEHEWHKVNLMTREDGTDLWKCDKCGGEFIRRSVFDSYPIKGCNVE